MNEKKQKQLIFDIDTTVAKELCGSKYNHLYDKIEDFLLKNGFEHVQGSGYESIKPMSNIALLKTVRSLKKSIPELNECMRDIRVADISKSHDLNSLFSYSGSGGQLQMPHKRRGR